MIQGAWGIGRRHGPPPQPYDARVLYVETDGLGAYIDTGVIPIFLGSGASVVKLSAKYVTLNYPTGNGRNYLCGARWGTSHATGVSFGACTGYSSAAGTTFRFILPTKTGQAPFDYNIRDIVMADGVLVVDGVDQQVTPSTTTHDPSTSFCLGSSGVASMLPSDPTQHFSNARFYSCKIYTNNVLVFDGIPVRKNGQGYIYDRVSGRLCGNAGASGTAVTYGADVPFDEYVEYLESTGTQYIDTGIVPYYGLEYGCIFRKNDSQNSAIYGVASGGLFNIIGFGGIINGRFGWFPNLSMQETSLTHDTLWHASVMNISDGNQTMVIDGVNVATRDSTGVINKNLSMILFGRRGASSNYLANCCVSSFSIVDTSTSAELIHLRPVRVGQVGYMYDCAHPTGGTLGNGLYPNLGTGEFTVGADR